MNRRDLLLGAGGMAIASEQMVSTTRDLSSAISSDFPVVDEKQWMALDSKVKAAWAATTSKATEAEIRQDASKELLFLPFPYVSPTAPGGLYNSMFGWDTDFISRALIQHGALDQVRNHILNYMFMIDRYGYMPNANSTATITRSQTPLIADTVWRYYLATKDRDLLQQTYPRLKRNFLGYWTADHHQTPTGLATNRDLGDPNLPADLAAEAETGLDWTPVFGRDVRRCVPLITNCALVRYARDLSNIARALGEAAAAREFAREAVTRSARIRQYCWNEEVGFFFEYDYVGRTQLPYRSDCALWTLWAGVATPAQARHLTSELHCIEQSHGLSSTDQAYPLPRAEKDYGKCRLPPAGLDGTQASDAQAIGDANPLQWMYPAGWAPAHIIAVEGLDKYGYMSHGTRIASKFLALIVQHHAQTGHLWEKYNVVDGSLVLPNARCGNIWMYGWTAAAVALLGRRVLRNEPLSPIH